MADNVEITAGSGTTVAADDIGGVLHQRVKVEFGADGVAADVTSTNPFPVHLASFATIPVAVGTHSVLNAGGSLSAYQGGGAWLTTLATLPVVTNVTGYALESGGNLDSIVTTLNSIKSKTDNLDVTLGSRLGSGATLPITGTISALNAGGSLTAFQGSAPWLVTFATLPGIVSVNNSSIPVTQSGTWTVQPGNTPNTTAWLVTMATLPVNIGSLNVAGQATVTAIQGDPGLKPWLATLSTLSAIVDTELPAAAALGDSDGNPTTPMIGAANQIYNGSSWARARQVNQTLNASGTGYQGVGVIAQYDDTSPTAITENNFGQLRMSSRREMYVQLRDAAGNERGLNINADGSINVFSSLVSGTSMVGVGQYRPTLLSLSSMAFQTNGLDLFGNLMVNTNVALPNSTRFNRFLTFASMASIMAAPGTGKRLVIREMDFSVNATVSVQLYEDHAGTPVSVWGPHYFLPYAGFIKPTCYIPITSNKSLGITITGSSFNSTLDIRIETENT